MTGSNQEDINQQDIEIKVETAASAAADRAEAAATRAEELIRDVTDKASRRFEEIRGEAGHYAAKAGDAARDAAETGKGKAADALHTVAEAVRNLAGRAEGEKAETAAAYARRAADSMDRLSEVLKDKSLDEIGSDVRQFVRDKPAVAIGVAAVLGFALARALKSGGDDGHDA
jgi:ElaB/YqjD/DUF883 family membrane-anchored ribosome-binding protein